MSLFFFLVTPPLDDPDNHLGPFEQTSFQKGMDGLAQVFCQLAPYTPAHFYYGGPRIIQGEIGIMSKQRRALAAYNLRGRLPNCCRNKPAQYFQLPAVENAADFYNRLQQFFTGLYQNNDSDSSQPIVIIEHPNRVVAFLQNIGQKCNLTIGPLSHEANSISLVGFDQTTESFFLPNLSLLTNTTYLVNENHVETLAASFLSIFAPVLKTPSV